MHGKGAESLDMASGPRSRSTSISSDTGLPRMSLLSPPSVNPKPAFIASPAASQIITTDQEFNTADFVAEEEGPGAAASALVTPAALGALNGFLDHLLFNILAAAKSTRLSCIRPAVADVLKPRLAREVVSAADDELSEYIGGAEDEQFEFPGGQESITEFDLIRSWKLTRLRCMVYTRLGDMEEDDEDEYIAQEALGESDGSSQRFTSNVGNITPAAAIFLSSIVEYIGEQALVIAGETARSRLATKVAEHDEVTESGAERSSMNRLVVEDLDMEKLALNSTLGRLWRTWRKCVRSQTLGRAVSRESFRRPASTQPPPRSRKSSIVTAEDVQSRSMPATAEEPEDPAAIPLPMSQHDVREIEIPGFSAELDGEFQTLEAVVAHKVRPRSLMVFSPPSNSPRSPSSTASSPILSSNSPGAKASHGRSRSLPNASYFPDGPWGNEQNVMPTADEVHPDASEESKRLETMYEYDEPSDPANAQTGIAISTEQVDDAERELPQDATADSLPEEKKDPPGVDDDASMEVATSQTSSVSSSAETAVEQQSEIIEGQGMVEKPKAAVQRPKRKSSKDPSLAMRPVTEDQPLEQGEAAPAEPITNHDGSRPSDASTAGATFFVTEGRTSNDEPVANKSVQEPADSSGDTREPSESTSGDSGQSEPSRTRPKPSKLILPSGSSQASGKSASSPGTERAAVQRVSIRPSPSITSTHSNPRRSDSFTSARERRPVTSGSTTSQVSTKLKGLIARQPGEASSPRFRSSSETSRASGGSGDSDNLEKLIKSDETLHFTLTPKSMREMEEPESPRWRTVPRSDNAAQPEPAQNTSTAVNESQEPGSNASRRTVDVASIPKSRSAELPKPKPAERMSVQSKPKTTQARDARPTGESTRDFADFIKSSGPPIPASSGPSGAGSASPANGTPARSVNAVPKSPSRGNGPKLQARSAVPAKGDQTSDLIDFIREGPPTPGVHRIPRVVAPFRDTADSEDPETSEPERLEKEPPTRSSLASTQGSSMANKSLTSVGSRTGLLESTQRTATQTSTSSKVSAPSKNVSEDPFPARKQRRVKDPYAIDSDDEDDLDELLEPQKPKREEESLMDFLRNVPPPEAQPPPQPFNISSSSKARVLGKQSSGQGPPAKSPQQQQPGAHPAGQSNYAVKVGMERNGGSVRGPGIGGRQTETSALADFLKNTGPPEPPAPRAPEKKDSGANSISRLFTRRKKVEV